MYQGSFNKFCEYKHYIKLACSRIYKYEDCPLLYVTYFTLSYPKSIETVWP